ncbi:hypothetical protein HC928_02325 [bacterium]|nr:hypothetical protein [bacterium]
MGTQVMERGAVRTQYFIVVLTNQGKLISDFILASSIAGAMDLFIDYYNLAGQIVDYKFCVKDDA